MSDRWVLSRTIYLLGKLIKDMDGYMNFDKDWHTWADTLRDWDSWEPESRYEMILKYRSANSARLVRRVIANDENDG